MGEMMYQGDSPTWLPNLTMTGTVRLAIPKGKWVGPVKCAEKGCKFTGIRWLNEPNRSIQDAAYCPKHNPRIQEVMSLA